MHCTTLFSLATTVLMSISANAAPPFHTAAKRDISTAEAAAPSQGLYRRQASPSGALYARQAAPSGVLNARQAAPSQGFYKRQAAPSGVFNRQAMPSPGVYPRGASPDPQNPPYPKREDTDSEGQSETTASCECSGPVGVAPSYTISIPADMAALEGLGFSCPAQSFIDAVQSADIQMYGYGCQTNADGGLTLTFSSTPESDTGIDAALDVITAKQFPVESQCQQAKCRQS